MFSNLEEAATDLGQDRVGDGMGIQAGLTDPVAKAGRTVERRDAVQCVTIR